MRYREIWSYNTNSDTTSQSYHRSVHIGIRCPTLQKIRLSTSLINYNLTVWRISQY